MTLLRGTRVTWLGHATVLVETASGTSFLIDPFLQHNAKFPKDFRLPEKIDYVLLTHAHIDHTADAIPVAEKHGSTIVAIYELAGYMASKGAKSTIGMNLGGSVDLSGVTVSMVEAKHSSSLDEGGVPLYLGVAAGLVLSIPDGPVLYHAGDTAVFRDMELIRELYAPEVAMLPIGGCYTMGPREAALAVKYLQPQLILPIHWGTMPQLTGTPQQLAGLLDEPGLVALVAPGEALDS
jgi:L-ascorbate metabolism protein UlaG (beta-lactamase superfamily)